MALGTAYPATSAASQADITAAVNQAVSDLIDGAPGALDTLNELAAAINDDATFVTTVNNALAAKATLGELEVIRTLTDNGTLALTDAGGIVEMNAATAKTITVPLNSSVAFPVNSIVHVSRIGAGTLQIVPAGGVTINSANGNDFIATQYAGGTLYKRATDAWVLFGELSAS